MGRLGVDLLNLAEDAPQGDVVSAINELRRDFESHQHTGTDSRMLEDIVARSIRVNAAIIGGHRLFEAVVGNTASDFKSVAEALKAGKTRIFVRNGSYTSEPEWTIDDANTSIIGESLGGVSITFADSVNDRHINVTATRLLLQNLNLTSFGASDNDLIKITAAGGTYLTAIDCILKNKNGSVIEAGGIGGNSYATLRNIYIDFTETTSAAAMKGLENLTDALVENVYWDFGSNSSSGLDILEGCTNVILLGCRMRSTSSGNVPSVTSSSTCTFIGCSFYCHEIFCNANFIGCFFENNTNAPSGYFIEISNAGSRFINNYVKVSTSHNVLRCEAANVQINGNYFSKGKSISLDNGSVQILAGSFNNNTWITDYDTAAANITLGANADNWNLVYNVVRNNAGGGTNTPTLTNNSTGSNVTGNQLILG